MALDQTATVAGVGAGAKLLAGCSGESDGFDLLRPRPSASFCASSASDFGRGCPVRSPPVSINLLAWLLLNGSILDAKLVLWWSWWMPLRYTNFFYSNSSPSCIVRSVLGAGTGSLHDFLQKICSSS